MDDQNPRRAIPPPGDGGGVARPDGWDDPGAERDLAEPQAEWAGSPDEREGRESEADRAAAALVGGVLNHTDQGPMRIVEAKLVDAMPSRLTENKVPFRYVAAWGEPVGKRGK